MAVTETNKWALVLGGSSGLGLAVVKKLAAHDFNILVVHRDRRSDLPEIEKQFDSVRSTRMTLVAFNVDATSIERQNELIPKIKAQLKDEKIAVLVHSIAKGNLKPMQSTTESTLQHQDFSLTIGAMATSFYDWVKLLVDQELFNEDLRTIAFTSEGNTKAWSNYAAISAAKAALEAMMRNIALEFAPMGIKSNCIQAGVTETKSFTMIPGSATLKAAALERNPNKRLTTPEDVANVVYLMTTPEAKWITGTVLKVDGGESLR
ncbi:SDR family oxidoreductase [Croceitalea sp. MTPC5]|uniref:SDR family oxidoreductase n=1 Tax=Croceitalea sp. MTPC5 TaxID=3056565 RepID=UPI002B36457B|nr:SDR family oxidoreductase [Croceitalea sp. MTPC5]